LRPRTRCASRSPSPWPATIPSVLQSAHTHWFLNGGDLAERVPEGIAVLEHALRADPEDWPDSPA
jgi:hypothetical protein